MSKISKLGLGIIAFEGTEHIKNITYELRDLIDWIVVCLQKFSYDGSRYIEETDVNEVEHLKHCGLIDEIIWFESSNTYDDVKDKASIPRRIETDKRNFVLNHLQNKNMSQALVIDSDEFYEHDDFANAKKIYDENDNFHVSYCEYINYYRDYEHVLVWPFRSYVPFITDIEYRFSFDSGSFDRPSDPTRRYNIPGKGSFFIYPFNIVKMHHLSWIRIHIEKKISVWSAKKYFEKDSQELEKRILDRYYNYQDGQNAYITFNVPQFQVVVNRLPKQYIHMKYLLNEKAQNYDGRSNTNNGN